MSNFWIVSSYEFVLHKNPESAIAEAQRLQTKVGKPLHVYRLKDKLDPGGEPGRVALSTSSAPVRPQTLDPHTLEVLAAAVTKFAPDLGDALRARWAEAKERSDQALDEFLGVLRAIP